MLGGGAEIIRFAHLQNFRRTVIERSIGPERAVHRWNRHGLAAVLAIYLLYKYVKRNQLLRELRVARISVDELRKKATIVER